jgi:hypothetical protein
MLAPRLAATMLLTTLLLGSAAAQIAPEADSCEETTRRLDRELEALSQRLGREMGTEGDPRSVPATRAMVELIRMDALRDHLRCLGLRQEGGR